MTKNRQRAYRYLLYQAMLQIRPLGFSRVASNVPDEWLHQYERSRKAGALAECLHNLAHYSANDFVSFNEDWFWSEWESYAQRFLIVPGDWDDLRHRFNGYLADLEQGKQMKDE